MYSSQRFSWQPSCTGWKRRKFWGPGEHRATGAQPCLKCDGALEDWGEVGSAEGTNGLDTSHGWPHEAPAPYFCFSDVNFTSLLFPVSSSLFLWHLLLHQLSLLLISLIAFISTSPLLTAHPLILLSLCCFFFLSTPAPSCPLMSSLASYLRVPKCTLFISGLGRRFSFSMALLMIWKSISHVSGYPRKQNSGFWTGQILSTVFVRQRTRGKAASMRAPPKTEYSLLPLLAESGEQWHHFPGVLLLYHYTYPWSFSFSLSFFLCFFFSISVLFFTPIFHISPCSLFSSVFSYLLEITSLPSLMLLFGLGRYSQKQCLLNSLLLRWEDGSLGWERQRTPSSWDAVWD